MHWDQYCKVSRRLPPPKVTNWRKDRWLLILITVIILLWIHLTSLLTFFFFGPHCKAYEILVLQPGFKPISSVLEGRVLTSGPLGKSLFLLTKRHLSVLHFFISFPGRVSSKDGFLKGPLRSPTWRQRGVFRRMQLQMAHSMYTCTTPTNISASV